MNRILRQLVILAALACLASGCGFTSTPTVTPTTAAEAPEAAAGAEASAPEAPRAESGALQPSSTPAPVISIEAPLPGAQVASTGFDVHGWASETNRLLRIILRDVGGSILRQDFPIADATGRFQIVVSSNFPLAVTTPAQLEVTLLDPNGNPLTTQTVNLSLLPASGSGVIPTATPTVIAVLPPQPAGAIRFPANLQITSPRPGARVTFPIHIAGYLSTPQSMEVSLQVIFRYDGQEVSDTLTTAQWGHINIFIFNLDIPGGISAHPENTTSGALTIYDPANGNTLGVRDVILVGRRESMPVFPYFINRLSGVPQAVERRVPGWGGSNAALAELFWGLSNEEIKAGALTTYIPGPREIRTYYESSRCCPANQTLVHVLDSRVSYGVAFLTLSPTIRAATNPDRAAEQIRSTILQYPNVNDVAIAADGYLWPGSAPPTPIPPPTYTVPTWTPVPAPFQISITDPPNNVQVGNPFRVTGTATVPPTGRFLRLQLVIQGVGLLADQDVEVLGAAPGQIGAFSVDVAYQPPAQPTSATLTVTYIDATGAQVAQDARIINLTPAQTVG